jgi:hypothetical protein
MGIDQFDLTRDPQTNERKTSHQRPFGSLSSEMGPSRQQHVRNGGRLLRDQFGTAVGSCKYFRLSQSYSLQYQKKCISLGRKESSARVQLVFALRKTSRVCPIDPIGFN